MIAKLLGWLFVASIVSSLVVWVWALWLYHRRKHPPTPAPEPTLEQNIEALGRGVWFQHLVTFFFGILAGVALCLGWTADYCR